MSQVLCIFAKIILTNYNIVPRSAGGATTTNGTHAGQPANTKFGTGWISELNPRKGVLTFDNNGCDERVLFLVSIS
jgi:hypothetical protein